MNGDPLIDNNIICQDSYINYASGSASPEDASHVITIDITDFPGVAYIKRRSVEISHLINYKNVPLPPLVLYFDPLVPMTKYIEILMECGHRFRLMDGTELYYNGYDPTGMPRFVTKDRKRTYPISATLEYKFMILKKMIYAGALYLWTPTATAKAAEFFNISGYVVDEAMRHLKELMEVTIDGKCQIIEWNGRRFLVVYVDGTRGGRRGIVVAGSGRYEIYLRGNEKDRETLMKLAEEIKKLAKRENADMYLFVMDGGKWLANFFMEYFDGRCVIVEHSHITWWEVCVIYRYEGEWFTIRLRNDLFVKEKRSDPEIDIAPDHVEVWKGVVHVGCGRKIKREKGWIKSWRRHLNDTIAVELFREGIGDRAFRMRLSWWVKRINMLTRNLVTKKEDVSEFVERVKEVVRALCAKIKKARGENRYAKILIQMIPLLHSVYDEAKKMVWEEFGEDNKSEEKRKATRKSPYKKRRRNRERVKLIYYGPLSGAPEHAKNIIGLLKKVFDGKYITSNKAESLIGVYVHGARSCRGEGKILLKLRFQRVHIAEVLKFISSQLKFGRGPRGDTPRFHVGREYIIEYQDRYGERTTRRIKVLSIKKRHIIAYCYLRNAKRTFRRKGVLGVIPLQAV